ncbi:acyl-CoA N-acyltransferase [Polychaeton citri CBS 116435]|uniref:Acyl-CoA N-acyltransferase n=1 Tax=Polychaeton citri CBS 116435 TaxID=1314669 RepID=A0A9P4PWJ7_9PEZI|nr:acyl-CoA N-acyltransferase [Polychaeton citri CBS 116435]
MPIQVLPAEDSDFPRLFEVFSLAFRGKEPFVDAAYPDHESAAGNAAGAARFQKSKDNDPNARFFKAVDTSLTGGDAIVGLAKWYVYTGTPPADEPFPAPGTEGDYWTAVGGEELYLYNKGLQPLFLRKRKDAIERNAAKVIALDICCVDPGHQRKGVGHALVEWGTRLADEMGVESVVESSVFGKGLYEKNGFVFEENVPLDVPGWEGKREVPQFAWLVRPKKGQS